MKKIDSEIVNKIRDLAKVGLTQKMIADKFNIVRSSVCRFAKDIYVDKKRIRDKRDKQVRAMYSDGFDTAKVAEKFGLSSSMVKIICDDIMRPNRLFGEKNPAWRGGITLLTSKIRNSEKYSEWRLKVMERDNFTCVLTGQRGGKLVVDHIKPFAVILEENGISSFEEAMICEELWDIDNGRTISNVIHPTTETYGWKTYNLLRKDKNLSIIQ